MNSTRSSTQIRLRPHDQRLHTRIGWLDSWHSFSFGHHYDPAWMGHRALRVINDDIVAPGAGFDWHGHKDMEIITWVLSGALQHRDDTGAEGIIRPGEAQHMRAGRGIRHGEWNASKDEPVRLLQIWLMPNQLNLDPGHRQEQIPVDSQRGVWLPIAGGDHAPLPMAADGQVQVAQGPGTLPIVIADGDSWWLHLATGSAQLPELDRTLSAGDGLAIDGPWKGSLSLGDDGQVLAFLLT
ncbi:MAG: pirin family protein [Planctomycetota bacterium]|nr:MAG: pirin family protein [Planctomycetota bacterium]